MTGIQPTLDWYKETSRHEGGSPRCPFASVERCPRFYQSVSLLGEEKITTRMSPHEDRRLKSAWQETDLWPRTNEQATSIMGPAGDPRHFLNFCPEVLFERFGLFANNLSKYTDEIDKGVVELQLKAEHAPVSDWRWTWALATAMHYTDCPLYSPLTIDRPNRPLSTNVKDIQHMDRDPFRVMIGLIDNSDVLRDAAHAAGLRFDAGLSDTDAVSHKTRVRALVPRILTAYDALEYDSQLTAALATAEALRASDFDMAAVANALDKAGWELHDTGFVVRSPETREIFFPKGSPWDAFVVLRDLFAEARGSIFIVDPYCATSVFHMLEERPPDQLNVQILCSEHANAVAEGSKAFVEQHPHVTVEVRTTRDFHDRFIVLDKNVCVHVGASIKDAGRKAFMVSRIEDPRNRDAVLQQLDESWAIGTPVP